MTSNLTLNFTLWIPWNVLYPKTSKVQIGFWKKATIDAIFCFWPLRAQNYCHPDAEKIIAMIPSNLFNCAICISEQWMLYVWWMFLSHRKFITYLVFTSPQLNLFSLTAITRDLLIVAVELVAQHIQDIIYKRKIASKNGSPFTRSRSNSCGEISR